LAARAWEELYHVIGVEGQRFAEARMLQPAAEAALLRAGDPPGLSARYHITVAAVAFMEDRFDEAARESEVSLRLAEKASGPDSVDVANALNLLALSKRDLGQAADAVPYMERSLAISEKVGGAQHPSVTSTVMNLGIVYTAAGRHEDAVRLLERAARDYE